MSNKPRVAIVVPIFRHSALLSEAIESALGQQADFSIRLLLINDGCPHTETDLVCQDYARSHPDEVVYLRKPNGGLSDARNHGIDYVLEQLPSIEAVYFLDADNRLRPHAIARAMGVLEADPSLGWVYPNIDMFGMQSAHDYGGAYSRLLHTAINICEAGSLISRKVFESGVMFDTSFKQGFEDWEFFLSASTAGFIGANLEDFGFQYRKRAESMLAESEREGTGIRAVMQQKHKIQFQPKTMIEFEQKEAPRFAMLLTDRNEVRLTSDPAQKTEVISLAEYERRIWLAKANPSRHSVAPWLLVTTSGFMAQMNVTGMMHFTLWRLEMLADEAGVAVCNVSLSESERVSVHIDKPTEGSHLTASAIMVRPTVLGEVLADPSTAWIDSIFSHSPSFDLRQMTLTISEGLLDANIDLGHSAIFEFLSLIHRLRDSRYRQGALTQMEWRVGDLQQRAEMYRIIRQRLNGAVAYPRVKDGRHHIGLTIPIIEFGGVEKVALNIARELKARGYGVHVFILLSEGAAISKEWSDATDSVNFFTGTGFTPWGGGQKAFFGTEIPYWAQHGDHAAVLGALYWLDTVIDFHGGALMSVMGKLKKMGLSTVSSLHLSDMSPLQRPVGNTYLAMAYEHAFDVFAPCSLQLADWLHAMGVPQEKIVPVVNAPAFSLPENKRLRSLNERRTRDDEEPLQVLFLGRLDPQKGLERLSIAVEQTQGFNLVWRIVGKAVLEDMGRPLPPLLESLLEPALSTAEELADAYAWADVVVLLSEFEGLPLTILEAMRQGCVVVATDVGAVAEVVHDGDNGLLLSLDCASESCVRALETLSIDRNLLRRLSEQAAMDMSNHSWGDSVTGLLQALDTLQKNRKSSQAPTRSPTVRQGKLILNE